MYFIYAIYTPKLCVYMAYIKIYATYIYIPYLHKNYVFIWHILKFKDQIFFHLHSRNIYSL